MTPKTYDKHVCVRQTDKDSAKRTSKLENKIDDNF